MTIADYSMIGTLQFESPLHKSSYIKVIGVGGGGTNAVNHMYNKGIEGVDFIICNTDSKSLDSSPVAIKIKLGKSGLGAGNIPAVACEKALEKSDEIKEVLSHNTQMLFITAGMGGGTGTGAAPVIARLAKEIELDDDIKQILVVAIVTLPFSFEGRRRRLQAEEGIKEIRKYTDAVLVVNNDKLRDFGNINIRDAFSKADDILLTAAKGIAEIITVKSYINIDFRDVNTVMQNSGVALMGSGVAEGENRAYTAIEMAATSSLLNDNSIKGAKNILLYLSSGIKEIDMDEVTEITDYIHAEAGMNVDIIWGIGTEESLGDKLSITLIATGFESKEYDLPIQRNQAQGGKNVIVLKEASEQTNIPVNPTGQKDPHEIEEIRLITEKEEEMVSETVNGGNPIPNQMFQENDGIVLISGTSNNAKVTTNQLSINTEQDNSSQDLFIIKKTSELSQERRNALIEKEKGRTETEEKSKEKPSILKMFGLDFDN